eukprot:CAMPEP_0178423554 /NCGR_PEP_ID=MMETSP0689_2-20121128/27748_1 /TAXON_ID=160604 /ORGANISM="Amphidinium massartii, Strain CS-259" /LENGTH=53 /DNA_ID=CAMNT_0020045151 /DNA_START=138 /DNA_END=299 /DNA_ORIENTATION=+
MAYSTYGHREEEEHWTDYWGLILGAILLVVIASVLTWAYLEDQKDAARLEQDL